MPSPSSGVKFIGDCSVAVDIVACRAAGVLSCYWYVLSRAAGEVLQQSCHCDAALPQRWRDAAAICNSDVYQCSESLLRLQLADSLCSARRRRPTGQGWAGCEVVKGSRRGSEQDVSGLLHAIAATPPHAAGLRDGGLPQAARVAGVRVHSQHGAVPAALHLLRSRLMTPTRYRLDEGFEYGHAATTHP